MLYDYSLLQCSQVPRLSMTASFLVHRFIPPSWTYECDEDLVHFLYERVGKEDESLGNMKQFVESINVSSATVQHPGVTLPCPHSPDIASTQIIDL